MNPRDFRRTGDAFTGVEAGTYTVTISGYPSDATFAQVTQSATIATDGETVQLAFAGEYARSSAVVGAVVAADPAAGDDGRAETLAGVTVALEGAHASETAETDADGGFGFQGLRAGTYAVTISGYAEEVAFATESVEVEVGVGEVGNADFTGEFLRTSAVEGRVTVEGEGLAAVTVTLSGGPAEESHTTATDADGAYRFEALRPGDYAVAISDFEARDYAFEATSREVSVGLGETVEASFMGVLLRTSGISGRVSVEGEGLGDVAVTLSGVEERATTTDAAGQYSFAGLAAGDYAVTIAIEGNAYVFDVTSREVDLGDDASEIVNFDGAHARTASVSGFAFVDEATRNDEFDEGEGVLARAGIPVTLVGPTVSEQESGMTDAEGRFSFEGLKAGPYELVVPVNATVAADLAAAGVAYGGGLSYPVTLGVGEPATVALPFDITHTTVHFAVSLRRGEELGDALPGAAVALYADAAGENELGRGETDDDGMVSIRVARAGVAEHTVHAAVTAQAYHVAEGVTPVTWDPREFSVEGANANDIVNLRVDVTVSGATVSRGEYGGGAPLAGWTFTVASGEGADAEAAQGRLDEDGAAEFGALVEPGDLPASFAFAVAEDQDDALDGGEAYEATAVEHAHTGLRLARRVDAGAMEARYTTQTLRVYVHHELDQVRGYTGNLLGGDVRDGNGDARRIAVGLRHIDGSGRSRPLSDWNAAANTKYADGAWTFSRLPAEANVIVQASVVGEAGVMILGADELAAYRDREANGIEDGAFGANGGSSHTVSLCPLRAKAPQDHDECSSFAYVTSHTVRGRVWKTGVGRDPTSDGFIVGSPDMPTFVAGVRVSLSPVEGRNLAGEDRSETTGESDDDGTPRDERTEFSFGGLASGAYALGVSDGWRARMGGRGSEASLGNALNPLVADLELDVTPSTGVVYGRVTGEDGFAVEGVTVRANGRTDASDALGRYVIDGFGAETRTIGDDTHMDKVFVETAHPAHGETRHIVDFAANAPREVNIDLAGAAKTAQVSGVVRLSGTNAPVEGVEITVDGEAPPGGRLVTGADGSYTAVFGAKGAGGRVTVRASKAGLSFVPASVEVPAHTGAAASGIDFTAFANATISGQVAAGQGGPRAGVIVSATSTTDSTVVVSDTTGVTGTYALSVPFGAYTMSAAMADTSLASITVFTYPPTGRGVNVAPAQSVTYGVITASTNSISGSVVTTGGAAQEGVVFSATSTTDATAVFTDTTDANGAYLVIVPAGDYTVSAAMADTTLASIIALTYPESGRDVSVALGESVTYGNITAVATNISGRVVRSGQGVAGVVVSATSTTDATVVFTDTTDANGAYAFNVRLGGYTMSASAAGYTFTYPADGRTVTLTLGQSLNYGNITAANVSGRSIGTSRLTLMDPHESFTMHTGRTEVTWTADPVSAGHTVTYTIQVQKKDTVRTGDGGLSDWSDWQDVDLKDAAADRGMSPDTIFDFSTDSGWGEGWRQFLIRVVTASDNGTPDDDTDDWTVASAPDTVAESESKIRVWRYRASDVDRIRVVYGPLKRTNANYKISFRVSHGNDRTWGTQTDTLPSDDNWSYQIASGNVRLVNSYSWKWVGLENKRKEMPIRIDYRDGDISRSVLDGYTLGTDDYVLVEAKR